MDEKWRRIGSKARDVEVRLRRYEMEENKSEGERERKDDEEGVCGMKTK